MSGGLRWRGICHFIFPVASPLVSVILRGLPGRRGRGDLEMVLVRGHVNSSTADCPFRIGSDRSQRIVFAWVPLGSHPHSTPHKPTRFSGVGTGVLPTMVELGLDFSS